MTYSLTILEEHYDGLNAAFFSAPGREGAAYLLCNRSMTDGETRLLGREVIPVQDGHYLIREPLRLSIDSASYASVAKRAREKNASIVFVHSHPDGIAEFSRQDDREDPKLHEFFQRRVAGVPHGSLVISRPTGVRGRMWAAGCWEALSRVRVIGRRFRFFDDAPAGDELPEFYDRQVRAFGPDIQRLLCRLHVGVVGAGGTGSAVIEEVARLGVGTVSVFDGDVFDPTNTNRVYGSSTEDAGGQKVDIARDLVRRMGLGTTVHAYPFNITEIETAQRLRDCDVVFGCTDKHAPRALLVQLALRYLIPVFDTGVKIDSSDGAIRGVFGRVTTLLPGEACLFCRGRISPDIIRLETLSPVERRALVDEDYASEIDTPRQRSSRLRPRSRPRRSRSYFTVSPASWEKVGAHPRFFCSSPRVASGPTVSRPGMDACAPSETSGGSATRRGF